jgi:carboxylate-amine ligase
MSLLLFKSSQECSLGIELELQIVNPHTGNLVGRAKELIRSLSDNIYSQQIKPELTQSMIEVNSMVHLDAAALYAELIQIKKFMNERANQLGASFVGGGTHPFQQWKDRKIFPTFRFKKLSEQYGYLAKRFTVFGQHIHIGCNNPEDALYLTQGLLRYIPHFIALSASSPFYQGVDTSFDSSRVNVVSAFPTSGTMPFMRNWEAFSDYIEKLIQLKIIGSLKDLYWDIRPKPEFGTVELRILDTPLTLKTAVMLAAYAQTIARYLLRERPIKLREYDSLIYNYNRYQASRYGFQGDFIHPYTEEHITIAEDILSTIEKLEPHTTYLNNAEFIAEIQDNTLSQHNDAKWLRNTYAEQGSLKKLVMATSQLWMNEVEL